MNLFVFDDQDDLIAITDNLEAQPELRTKYRNDLRNMRQAIDLAQAASELKGESWIPVDKGPACHPRYDVVRAPHVGDEVSRYFNGDCAPCGTIVKISKSLRRVETSEGEIFWRRGQSGTWLSGGTWSLSHGHHHMRNPHL